MNFSYDILGNIRENISIFQNDINVSFEFFPPKSINYSNSNFLNSIEKLSVFHPKFISITCTAHLDSVYDYTAQAIKNIPTILNLNIAPHIIYVNSNKKKIQDLAHMYWNNGIKNIIALRGDIQEKNNSTQLYASELILLLKQVADFDISVAAYPEVHPTCQNSYIDIMNLKNKINCGANRAITQFFFNVDHYLRFRDRCSRVGIDQVIVPGILPITNFQQIQKFTNMTNVHLPEWICNIFSKIGSDEVNISKMFGLLICVDMVNKLYKEGIRDFHFYTLNQFDIVYTLCCYLGLKVKK